MNKLAAAGLALAAGMAGALLLAPAAAADETGPDSAACAQANAAVAAAATAANTKSQQIEDTQNQILLELKRVVRDKQRAYDQFYAQYRRGDATLEQVQSAQR
ncbi:hypothetical protein, partial [Salmonella enterica]|uniref:hypothetical protein n=1 Tax=Salmonella enterica TaxID=28901 RepID=UPI003297AA6A